MTKRKTRRLSLLVSATVLYVLAAWMVQPGFYDSNAPLLPYNWVCPPVQVSGAKAPASGHLDIKVTGGVSEANSAVTSDGQVAVGFLPGAFDATGRTSIGVDITPVSPCPSHPGLTFVTNVYHVTADAPLTGKTINCAGQSGRGACVVMTYSNLIPAPSNVYYSSSADGPWRSLGGGDTQPFVFAAATQDLGYFAAGYPEGAVTGGGLTSRLLPIAVAILIVGVLVASIPLAVVRRRRAGGADADEEEADA